MNKQTKFLHFIDLQKWAAPTSSADGLEKAACSLQSPSGSWTLSQPWDQSLASKQPPAKEVNLLSQHFLWFVPSFPCSFLHLQCKCHSFFFFPPNQPCSYWQQGRQGVQTKHSVIQAQKCTWSSVSKALTTALKKHAAPLDIQGDVSPYVPCHCSAPSPLCPSDIPTHWEGHMSNCTVTAWQGQAQAREMTWDRATSDMICTALDMPVAVPAALRWELTGRRLLSLQRKALCLCCTYCITILASCTSKNYIQRDDASVTKYFPMPTANLASLCDRKYCKKK